MKKFSIALSLVFIPVLAFAADFRTFDNALRSVNDFINSLVPIIIGIGLILFLAGILKYIMAGGDAEKRAEARGLIIFGIIALFVMVAVWGFVRILAQTFFNGVDYTVAPSGPTALPNRTN